MNPKFLFSKDWIDANTRLLVSKQLLKISLDLSSQWSNQKLDVHQLKDGLAWLCEDTHPVKSLKLNRAIWVPQRMCDSKSCWQQKQNYGKRTSMIMVDSNLYVWYNSTSLLWLLTIQWKSICIHIRQHIHWIDDIYAPVNWVHNLHAAYCGALMVVEHTATVIEREREKWSYLWKME